MYTHADLSGEEGVTPPLPRQLTLSHVARVGPRLVSRRQLTLMCIAESIALSAALVTADGYGLESIARRPRQPKADASGQEGVTPLLTPQSST